MKDALTLNVFLHFSTAVSPQKEVLWLVGPTLCKFQIPVQSLLPLSANSECFSQRRINTTSICVNRIMGLRFSKSIEKTSSVCVWRGGDFVKNILTSVMLFVVHFNTRYMIFNPHDTMVLLLLKP
jgi:hypothetical protein